MSNPPHNLDAVIVADQFDLTLHDYQAMLYAQPRNRVRGWKAHAILWVAVLINIGASILFLRLDGNLFGYAWLSYVNGSLGLGILFLSYVLRPIVVRRHYKISGIGNHKYQWFADEAELTSKREGVRSQFEWSKLIRATETKEHFFFWISKTQAVILPKRALKNENVLEKIRSYLANAGVKLDG